jgi:hypothetical protein
MDGLGRFMTARQKESVQSYKPSDANVSSGDQSETKLMKKASRIESA